MKIKIEDYNTIAKQLKNEYPKLSDFEILSLAIQIERNQILENGLNVASDDSYPSALTSIAISLGYTGEQFQNTVAETLMKIANKQNS